MSLLGEEVVEEWLNRQGYFTIRGVKLGVDEIDILAIKPNGQGKHTCRHIEVQVSVNPISYISKVPKALQKERGIGPDNAKTREPEELKQGVKEWVDKKFNKPDKVELRQKLCDEDWTKELVVHCVRHEEELGVFKDFGVQVHRLDDVVADMTDKKWVIQCASGDDLVNLMLLRKM